MNKNLLAASAATLAMALTVASCGNASDPKLNQTGATPDLPKVNETLVPPMKISQPAGWNGETPKVPQGFTISAFATDLKIPRQMLVLPNGDVLIAEGRGGHAPAMRPKDVIAGVIKKQGNTKIKGGNRITLVRDANNDGTPELRTVLVDNLDAPYGMAYVDGYLYVAEQGALVRFAFQPGQTGIATPAERVTELPSRINHHWTKSLTASADGSKLYVGTGSNSNIGERGMAVEEERATVWEIDRATGARRTIATGIRNPTALAIEPTTNLLWSVVNERDELGPQLVPDYLTQVRDGAFYGWPYSYWGQNRDPRVMPQNPEMVAKAIRPDYALGSHVAALGLDFARNGGFGGSFANGAFIGMHGSWNRQDPSGYKVVWVPFNAGRPAGQPVDFATGFLKDGKARGRPVGVAFDGARRVLFVADDLSNTVWRIAPAR
ncbi:sorbosone dehydrogenase family protein [Brevundimonas sp. BT-123]|uniref:PQQ-dependent sugar dehydrogenase n=1 Tax=Brevundimonas sp. BT-123 TaxID=2986928 RepID=UPI002235D47B|nr:sorbosone dehydrogenase family protein [Brevundimonas sp. BT-123]MCW0046543.1 sorbosone dehydrogenase family protein [Brevundimonas sp. BT-123]